MKKLLIFLALVTILNGCASKPASVDGDSTEAAVSGIGSSDSNNKQSISKTLDGEIKFFPTYDEKYKTGSNEMYDFWFDIPNEWKAADQSADGSEYTIFTDNDKVLIKISGEMITEPEDEYYTKLAGNSGTITDFTYRDGWVGKKIGVSGTETWYVRVDGDSYMALHINAADQTEWLKQNEEKLSYVAMSERTTKESYGKGMDGENSVTLDDLQFGSVKLDMSYDELMKVLKQKPDKEEKEEYEGLEARTLFFADNTQIYVVDGAVYSINVTSPGYVTPRGLKVGDSTDRLIELYGEPDSKEDENHWGYNYNGYEVFTIIVEDGKVKEMQVDLVM
jgi:hypothetical protein